jgi:23S rRNA U2552 (ribose-2'-O)-methylase RlmE/FtsJ
VRAYLCSAGSEPALAEEIARAGAVASELGPGVVASDGDDGALDPIFARQALPDARLIEGASVRALAEAIFAAVEAAIDQSSGPFVMHTLTHAEPPPGLASRAALVGRETLALLSTRRRRAFRRHRPIDAEAEAFDAFNAFNESWLLVQLVALGRDRFLVSAAAPRPLPAGGLDLAPWPGGDAPVAIDRAPPSRAYQKLEEAFAWMGTAPRSSETCVDLGASPGGWTATMVKHGARVVAVDRAPLAPELARHPHVTSVIGNAFTYRPEADAVADAVADAAAAPVDWLVSDVVCEPPRSLALCDAWLSGGLCRNLVVTVKFKGRAGYGVLAELSALFSRLRPEFARVKQLAHNKNEVTVMVSRKRRPETAAAK